MIQTLATVEHDEKPVAENPTELNTSSEISVSKNVLENKPQQQEDKSASPEVKHHDTEVQSLDLENPATKLQLMHFKDFKREAILELEKKYQKTIFELEELITKNPCAYKFFYFNMLCTLYLPNASYVYFPIATSAEGFIGFMNAIAPSVTVSKTLAYTIGGPLAATESLYYLLVFSVRQEAIKDTLDYLHEPYLNRIKRIYHDFKNTPLRWFKKNYSYFYHESVLFIVNATGCMTELIYWNINYSSPYGALIAFTLIMYGVYYFMKFNKPDYYDGIALLKNPENLLYLWNEIKHARISVPIQVLLQSFSAIALRAFPLFYYIAVASREIYSWYPSPLIISILTVLQSIPIFFPVSYDFYVKAEREVNRLLLLDPSVLLEAQENILKKNQSMHDLPKELLLVIQSRKNNYRNNILNDQGKFGFFKNHLLPAGQITFRSFMGGLFAYELTTYLTKGTTEYISLAFAIPLSALLFGKLLYNAELQTITTKMQWHELKKQRNELVPEEKYENQKVIGNIGTVINWTSKLAGAMSTIGTLKLLAPSKELLTTAVIVTSIEQMFNNVEFAQDKMVGTIRDIVNTTPCLSKVVGTLFRNPSQPHHQGNTFEMQTVSPR